MTTEKKTLHLESRVDVKDHVQLERKTGSVEYTQWTHGPIPVLDKGYVKLVDFMGKDEDIISAARMSTKRAFVSWEPYVRCKKCEEVFLTPGGAHAVVPPSACQHDFENFPRGDVGTLEYLWGHKHATPFEMCELVVEVQAPIMVFREWHRHRTQSYNEMSARYTQMPNLHYVPDYTRVQAQSATNKQGSGEALDITVATDFLMELEGEQALVYEHYETALSHGVAKELARLNTPVSRYSRMRAKANLRNWLGFLNLRLRPGAQWEIRQYAKAVGGIIAELFPRTWALFEEYDLYAASFSRSELRLLREVLKDNSKAQVGLVSAAADRLPGRRRDEFLEKMNRGGEELL